MYSNFKKFIMITVKRRKFNMSKWVCKVCGYVYEGDELPEDYVCPLCGVGPEEFEKVEE